jgi:hypothetical protein
MREIVSGEVFWYAVGCFFEWKDGSVQDFGYFVRLGDLPEPLFHGAPGTVGAAGAFFTFAADPFVPINLPPNDRADTFAVSLDPPGRFHLYFQPEGGASFEHPESFARGLEIATFERVGRVGGAATAQSAANLFTARLVSSVPFEFNGQRFDLQAMLGRGITQMGAAGAPFTPADARASSARSFVGTAVRL